MKPDQIVTQEIQILDSFAAQVTTTIRDRREYRFEELLRVRRRAFDTLLPGFVRRHERGVDDHPTHPVFSRTVDTEVMTTVSDDPDCPTILEVK